MATGIITKLVPLTSQSHLENSAVVPGHNDLGYGQIDGGNGGSIYFPHDAVQGCRFEQLWVGQEVDFEADPKQADRAKRVVLVHNDADLAAGGVKNPPPRGSIDRPGTADSEHAYGQSTPDQEPAMLEQDNEDLLAKLAEFEAQLETPVVPGELETWLEACGKHLEWTGVALQGVTANVHPEKIASIVHEDPELQARVEQLQEEDQRLLEQHATLQEHWHRLSGAVVSVEPHESKADELMQDFTAKALALVIAIRKQEQSIKTWMIESLERDRGDVD